MAARKEAVDLDKIVDYRAEYAAVVEGLKPGGEDGGLIGRCPFHHDRNRSFSVNPKTGMWHCFTEDEGGNFVTFWAKVHNVDTKQAYKEILEKYGVSTEKPKAAAKQKKEQSSLLILTV